MDLNAFFASDPNYENVDRQFVTYTGVDMRVVFGAKEIASVSALSVTITRDVVPRYITGRTNPAAFARGRRGIAGTMQFQVFDRDPLLRDLYRDDYYQSIQNTIWKKLHITEVAAAPGTAPASDMVRNILDSIRSNVGKTIIKYADQLPPTDVTVSFCNDQGYVSVARLIGVVFLSAGMAWSMGDVETEQATTYLARDFQPLTPVWEMSEEGGSAYSSRA